MCAIHFVKKIVFRPSQLDSGFPGISYGVSFAESSDLRCAGLDLESSGFAYSTRLSPSLRLRRSHQNMRPMVRVRATNPLTVPPAIAPAGGHREAFKEEEGLSVEPVESLSDVLIPRKSLCMDGSSHVLGDVPLALYHAFTTAGSRMASAFAPYPSVHRMLVRWNLPRPCVKGLRLAVVSLYTLAGSCPPIEIICLLPRT